LAVRVMDYHYAFGVVFTEEDTQLYIRGEM
jgi:hypothetical protein